MSYKIQDLIWGIEFPNPVAKIIALRLAHHSRDGKGIYPSLMHLVKATGTSRSIVCKWLRAMEHAKILRVVKRSAGGSKNDLTHREFNLALLNRLAERDYGSPPELRLVERDVLVSATLDEDTGRLFDDAKMVKIRVLEVVPNTRAPVREEDGSDCDPSAKRTRPVRQKDSTRPPKGPEQVSQSVHEQSRDAKQSSFRGKQRRR